MADFKFSCPNCSQHIACDTGYSGMQINCPTCKQAIVVPQAPRSAAAPPAMATPPPMRPASPPPPPPPSAPPALGTRQSTAAPAAGQRFAGAPGAQPPKKKSGVLKIVVGVTSALVGLAVGYFGVTYGLKHFSGGGKSKANPAAQVATPTAAATIQALSILSKIYAAHTNMTGVKADSTITLFLDISNITMADVSPKPPTDPKVAARHPPGMPKFITNSTEVSIKWQKPDLHYLAGDAVSKIDRMTVSNTFAFWSSDKGKFMFTDSHIRGIQPIYRQLADSNAPSTDAEQFKNIQQLFADPANLTKIIKDLGQTADESVNGQDCYTLTAKVLGQKVKVWVDKTTYTLPQWQITLGGQISDADIDDVFSLYSLIVTNTPPAMLDMIKTQVKKNAQVVAKIRGMITSTSRNIELSPTLTADDFNYQVPSGVRLIPMFNRQRAARTATPATSTLEERQRNACISNLGQIDAAKNQFALEKGKATGTDVKEADITPYLVGGKMPTCPAGGKYCDW